MTKETPERKKAFLEQDEALSLIRIRELTRDIATLSRQGQFLPLSDAIDLILETVLNCLYIIHEGGARTPRNNDVLIPIDEADIQSDRLFAESQPLRRIKAKLPIIRDPQIWENVMKPLSEILVRLKGMAMMEIPPSENLYRLAEGFKLSKEILMKNPDRASIMSALKRLKPQFDAVKVPEIRSRILGLGPKPKTQADILKELRKEVTDWKRKATSNQLKVKKTKKPKNSKKPKGGKQR